MGRLLRLIVLLGFGLMAMLALFGALAGTTQMPAVSAPPGAGTGQGLLWGLAGFAAGALFRTLLWDLPSFGMAWVEHNRRHAGPLLLLVICAAVLILV